MDLLEDIVCISAGHIINLTKAAIELCGDGRNAPVNPYLKGRISKGRFARDFKDLVECKEKFYENFHMDYSTFMDILSRLEGFLKPKRKTHPEDGISPKEKLAIVLEYFACGTLQRHIASIYRVSKQHFGTILNEVCVAIITVLKDEIPPMMEESMILNARSFEKWNFPNCVGAIDGKHCALKCPPNSGSMFFNYKGFYSIVLLAVCDGDYKFTYIDVGAYGSEGDANVFHKSSIGQKLLNDQLPFPKDAIVGEQLLPHFLVADDAFLLHQRIMKPYTPQRNKRLEEEEQIFNYRLSRSRRCIENAFGVLCSKFYCLSRKMYCFPDKAQKIITACCYLHNFMIRTKKEQYCPSNYVDRYNEFGEIIEGDFRLHLPNDSLFSIPLQNAPAGRHSFVAKTVRENLKQYFVSDAGSIPWQRRSAFLD